MVLDEVEEAILNLAETTDQDARQEAMGAIFRKVHSIKGNSGFFHMEAINSFAHELESILSRVRDCVLEVTKDVGDRLLAGVDILRQLVTRQLESPDTVIALAAEEAEFLKTLAELDQGLSGKTLGELEESFKTVVERQRTQGGCEESLRQIGTILNGMRQRCSLDFLKEIHIREDLEGKLDSATAEIVRIWAGLLQSITGDGVSKETGVQVEGCHKALLATTPADASHALRETINLWQFCTDEFLGFQAELIDEYVQRAREYLKAAFGEDLWAPSTRTLALEPEKTGEKDAADTAREAATKGGAARKVVQIDQDRLDFFLAEVSELTVAKNVFDYVLESSIRRGVENQVAHDLRGAIDLLDTHTTQLQRSLMEIRRIPVGAAFQKFRRVVRDLAGQLGKEVEFTIKGESVEIDRNVMEKLNDPLVHMLRNSLDHGLEPNSDARREAGKAQTGQIVLAAAEGEGFVEIRLSDDGRGINAQKVKAKAIERGLVSERETERMSEQELIKFIYQPGFSTADQVTAVSGRGVGLDVVSTAMREMGGDLRVQTTLGKGTTFVLRIPVAQTIVTKLALLVGVNHERFLIPLDMVLEIACVPSETIQSHQDGIFVKYRGKIYAMLNLRRVLGFEQVERAATATFVLVRTEDGEECALCVDEVLGSQKIVVRGLEHRWLEETELFAGTAVMGDGSAIMVFDVQILVRRFASATTVTTVTV